MHACEKEGGALVGTNRGDDQGEKVAKRSEPRDLFKGVPNGGFAKSELVVEGPTKYSKISSKNETGRLNNLIRFCGPSNPQLLFRS